MSTQGSNTGPLGQRRGILFVLLISLITIGIYTLYWAYKTHEEMKQHTGDGLGGVLGLVIWIIVNPVSAFVIPSEIGKMYNRSGRTSPVTGWTGLWLFPFGILIIPLIVWFVKVQGALNQYWQSASVTSPSAPMNEPGVPA
jgi:Na+/proline symporter